jgi:hypothetical protein
MSMAHLEQITSMKVPVAALDEIVRDARRVPDYWVGMSAPLRAFGDGGPGSKAEFTLEMLGTHQRLTMRTIEERHNPDGSTDWRWEYSGGMSGSLTCHHEPRDEGLEATTRFDYTLRGGVFGRLFDRAILARRVRRDFEDSLENLRLLAETSAAKPLAKAA